MARGKAQGVEVYFSIARQYRTLGDKLKEQFTEHTDLVDKIQNTVREQMKDVMREAMEKEL